MKIGELASRAGLNASAVRYYEKVGLLAGSLPRRGLCRYPEVAVHRVLLIRFANVQYSLFSGKTN